MNQSPQRRITDSPEARREFLRGLPKSDFVPPEDYMIVPSDEARSLRAEIDAFGERFWSMTQSDRQEEWLALSARAAADAWSQQRLQRLEPFLERMALSDTEFSGHQGMIVLALKELCTMAPPERAARRSAFLREVKPPLGPWQRAAAIVLDRRPDIAALDRPLIDRLVTAGIGKRHATRKPLPATFQEMAASGWSFPVDVPGPPGEQAPRPERPVKRPASKISVLILIAISMMTVRACTTAQERVKYAPRDYELNPKYLNPNEKWWPPRKGLDDEQSLKNFEELQRLLREKGLSPNPPSKGTNPPPGPNPP